MKDQKPLKKTFIKQVALIAHDAKKKDIIEWSKFNKHTLSKYCNLWATKTTGQFIQNQVGLKVHLLLSGPQGGDSQIGAMISEKKVHILIFFWDPLTVQPHDVDVKALLRLAVFHDIPTACNRASANYIISSSLF